MSPDGSNRRQVWTAAPGENLTGAVAGDGQALYLTVRVLGRQMGDTCRELRCIELAAGHVRTLITLPDTAWLMGAGAGKLLVLCHGDDTDTWLSCNPTDGTAAELYQYANDYGPAAPTAVPDGYTLWLFAPGKGNSCHLIHRDLITGQETEFQTDIPYYGGNSLIAGTPCNGELFVTVQDIARHRTDWQAYLIHLADGTARPVRLSFRQGNIAVPCEPLAAVGSRFLVQRGIRSRETMLTGQDGTHYATTVEIPDLALIEQQDYLDGAPNWLPLEEETGAS